MQAPTTPALQRCVANETKSTNSAYRFPGAAEALEVDNFKTRINNFLDHSNIGESNVFIPITVDGARLGDYAAKPIDVAACPYLAYSNHFKQRELSNGGLICTSGCDNSFDYTPSSIMTSHTPQHRLHCRLPARSWFSSNVCGSGFSTHCWGGDGDGNFLALTRATSSRAHDVRCIRRIGLRWKTGSSP